MYEEETAYWKRKTLNIVFEAPLVLSFKDYKDLRIEILPTLADFLL